MDKKIVDYKELFNDIIKLKYSIQLLAGFVQNDFEQMLNDKIVDKEYIKSTIPVMNNAYDEVVNELNQLRKKTEDILTFYSK